MEEAATESPPDTLELLSLANEFNALGGTYFAMYITLVSGYLVAAYLAGSQLTRGQARLVNAMFIFSSIYFLWSTMSMWFAGVSFYVAAGTEGWKINLYLTAGLNLLLSFAMFAGIIASLQFMRSIRARGRSGEG